MDRSYPDDQPVGVEGNRSPTGATKQAKVCSYTAMPPPIPKKDGLRANAWTVVKRAEFNTGKYAPNHGDDVRFDIAIAIAIDTAGSMRTCVGIFYR